MKRLGLAVIAALAVMAASGAAEAARLHYYTYEPNSDSARYRSQEITLIVQAGMWGSRVRRLYRTRGHDMALGRPDGVFSEGQLHRLLADEDVRGLQLYSVDTKDGEGFAHGACKGADRAWVAFTPVRPYHDLRIYVLKYDAETKAPAVCETLDYRWRAEWQLPDRGNLARMEGEEDAASGPPR